MNRVTGPIVLAGVLAALLQATGCSQDNATARKEPAVIVSQDKTAFQGDNEPSRFDRRRARMVKDQIAHPRDDRPPVKDPNVLRAMEAVPRHEFVPAGLRDLAYADQPLPIGHSQTISQPYIVAYMTELLRPQAGQRILEVGTGSGYQAAVLAEIVGEVYSIEIVEPLGREAADKLKVLGYDQVEVRIGDGYLGWPEHAPFDGIIVTAAPDHVPAPLIEQLGPGGRMVIPVGPVGMVQDLTLIEKGEDGRISKRSVMPVGFVPLTGER